MNCQEVSNTFLYLADNGQALNHKHQILNKSQTKRINALLQTYGFYDESGEFAFKVGLPGKSELEEELLLYIHTNTPLQFGVLN